MATVSVDKLVYKNLNSKDLFEESLKRQEGVLSKNGSISVTTGKRTGRSPKDRFIVQDAITQHSVDWGIVNQSISEKAFKRLWNEVEVYLQNKERFQSDLHVGSSSKYTLPVTVVTELAWQNLYARHMFIRGGKSDNCLDKPWTVVSVPSFKTDPSIHGVNSDGTVIISFSDRRVLICGIKYAGEIKKSMFSVYNFLASEHGLLSMHCSANKGEKDDVAIFFGLSGTGKTTLSADPSRFLIGDDEHVWTEKGIVNLEGGCYAKCVGLKRETEQVIWDSIKNMAIMENVVLTKDGSPDYDDTKHTKNTRAAYPREHIEKRVIENSAGHPSAVIFLTCDLYGVLPPIAKLTKQQAAYHFMSGYTALVGSTEVGSSDDVLPTFSACFGAPFFPRHVSVYAELLMYYIEKTRCKTYLINTGWTGGCYGKGGVRFSIPLSRQMVDLALSGDIENSSFYDFPGFNFKVPEICDNIAENKLKPWLSWQDTAAYWKQLNELIHLFQGNFNKFNAAEKITQGGPIIVPDNECQ